MLDIRKIRDDAEDVRSRLAKRGPAVVAQVDHWLAIDQEWRKLLQQTESLKAEKNRLAKEGGARKAKGEDASDLFARSKAISTEMETVAKQCLELEEEMKATALIVPNAPHASVPEGADADANVEVGLWGQKPIFSFSPKTHIDLGTQLGLLDFEAGTRVAGSGFAVYRGEGARLERALISYLLDRHTSVGYTEVSPPFLVLRDCMVGTGQLPKFEEDMYAATDGLFLAPTAEVPVTNLHREQLLKESELPIRYAAYTPCFRREAGSSGRDTRGLIRMHQFDKVELVKIVRPSDSYTELDLLRKDAEAILESLGLHYRTIVLCSGDMGFGAAKCYDIEVWAPGEGRYLEVSSCSNFEDFQARRMQLRFKDAEGKNHLCHTLNGSGTALARLFVALIETYQQPDGSILLPEALAPYMNGQRKIGCDKMMVANSPQKL